MSVLPPWIRRASEPTAGEVSRVAERGLSPERVRQCAQATEPADALVARFVSLAVARRKRSPWPALVIAGGAMAAASLLVGVWMSEADRTVEAGTIVQVEASQTEWLAPAVAMNGSGSVRVLSITPEDVRAEMQVGVVEFVPEPVETAPELELKLGIATLWSRNARFEAALVGDMAIVRVYSGTVKATAESHEWRLRAGDVWRWPDLPVVTASSDSVEPATVEATTDEPTPLPQTQLLSSKNRIAALFAENEPENEPPGEERPPRARDQKGLELYREILDRRDQGETAELEPLVQRFLADYPDSPFGGEVEMIWLTLEANSGPAEWALANLEAWLVDHPRAPERAKMLELAATVARDRLRDCKRALPLYRSVTELLPGERGARAQAYRGLCAASLGEVEEARGALAAALKGSLDPELEAAVRETQEVLP